ncbi:MAG: hypothetical protein LIP77_11050 [Planctomycetes bacterium]|nr:hypothetical protein [Planctomycetota bacterium]
MAMTRARRELVLTWNRGRLSRGKEKPRLPSRFLAEIPEEYLETEETPTRREEALDWLAGLKARLGGDPGADEGLAG